MPLSFYALWLVLWAAGIALHLGVEEIQQEGGVDVHDILKLFVESIIGMVKTSIILGGYIKC